MTYSSTYQFLSTFRLIRSQLVRFLGFLGGIFLEISLSEIFAFGFLLARVHIDS